MRLTMVNPWWFHGGFMRTTTATANMGTTAVAVSFAYATAMVTGMFTAWSSPAVKHANKRFTRRPSGGVTH